MATISHFIPKLSVKSPNQCGSVGWATSRKQKGHGFYSWSGHMPGLQAESPCMMGMQEATHQCFCGTLMFLSLSPSIPLSLKRNEIPKKTKTNKQTILNAKDHGGLGDDYEKQL